MIMNEQDVPPAHPASKEDAAQYIVEIVQGLIVLTREHDMPMLLYLLEMAAMQAESERTKKSLVVTQSD